VSQMFQQIALIIIILLFVPVIDVFCRESNVLFTELDMCDVVFDF
jgi:hypothetical protein